MRLSLIAPAVMRACAGFAVLAYGIYETATWHDDGAGSLRAPILTVVAITTICGWIPLLTEARVRVAIQEEHANFLAAMDERERERAAEKHSRRAKLEADDLLRQRLTETPSGKLVELRRTGF